MLKPDDDENSKNHNRSAKLIYINALVRVLIFCLPVAVALGIMFFFRSKIGFSLGVFIGGFLGIFRIVIYYYDKSKQNYYYHYYKTGHLISDILFVVGIWWFALYIFLH